MLENRYRIKDLAYHSQRPVKDYIDRGVAIVNYLTNPQLRDC